MGYELEPRRERAVERAVRGAVEEVNKTAGRDPYETERDTRMTKEEERGLARMGVGEALPSAGGEEVAVWKMVMGKDMLPGEGEVRMHES